MCNKKRLFLLSIAFYFPFVVRRKLPGVFVSGVRIEAMIFVLAIFGIVYIFRKLDLDECMRPKSSKRSEKNAGAFSLEEIVFPTVVGVIRSL
jgi:hypothetical protein